MKISDKRQYLKALMKKKRSPSLTHDDRGQYRSFPLMPIQIAYLYGRYNKFDTSGCYFYHEFTLDQLNIERLQTSFSTLIDRHPSLRLTINNDGKQTLQKTVSFPIPLNDLSKQTQSAQTNAIESVRSRLSHQVFPPDHSPYFSLEVSKLSNKQHIIHFGIDSWLIDGVSARIIFEEWYALYHDHAVSHVIDINYRDYVLAYQSFKETESYQRSWSYWAKQLRAMSCSPFGNFPELVPSSGSHQRTRSTILLSDLHEAIQASAEQLGVSISTVLLTAFTQFLGLYSAHTSFSITTTMISRPHWHDDLQQLVGAFTAPTIVTINQSKHRYFQALAEAIQQQTMHHLDHIHASMIEVFSAIRDSLQYEQMPPVVFTSHLSGHHAQTQKPSWLDHLSWGLSQTPGIYLECQVKLSHGQLECVWDYINEGPAKHLFKALSNEFKPFLQLAFDPKTDQTRFHGHIFFQHQFTEFHQKKTPRADTTTTPSTIQRSYLSDKKTHGADTNIVVHSFHRPYTDDTIKQLQQNIAKVLQNERNALLCYHDDQLETGTPKHIDKILTTQTLTKADSGHTDLSPVLVFDQASFSESFNKDECPLFKVKTLIIDNKHCIINIVCDMLMADALSIFMLSQHILMGTASPDNTPDLEAYRCSLPASALGPHHVYRSQRCQLINRMYPNATPRFNEKPIRKENTCLRLCQDTLHDLSRTMDIGIDSIISTCLSEGLLYHLSTIDQPLYSVLTNRDTCLGIADHTISDYSIVCCHTKLSTAHSFAHNASTRHHEYQTEIAHCAVPYFSSSPNGSVHAIPEPTFIYTSCLSSCYTGPIQPIGYRKGFANTQHILLDCCAFFLDGCITLQFDANTAVINPESIQHLMRFIEMRIRMLSEQTATIHHALPHFLIEHSPSLQSTYLELNTTDQPFNENQTLPELLFQSMQTHQNRTALCCGSTSITYLNLIQTIHEYAQHLTQHGLNRQRIAVAIDRSTTLFSVLLSVTFSGGCFIPIDPKWPIQRIQGIIHDAKASALITHDGLAKHYSTLPIKVLTLSMLPVNNDSNDQNQCLSPNWLVKANPASPAYIIYTSGSTGKPKGVLINHRSVINLIEWGQQQFGFDETDCCLSTSPITFDLAIFDLFGMLSYGASVLIASDRERIDGKHLTQSIHDHQVSYWNSTPAVFQIVLSMMPENAKPLNSIKTIFLSGDWIPTDFPALIQTHCPNATLVALGGATEATVWSNFFIVQRDTSYSESIPYGVPIQNCQYYVLDDNHLPCAANQAGELYIGGTAVAVGYTDYQVDQKHFSHDYLSNQPGRLYRTGDMAMVSDKGWVQLLGRKDHQVKIRGYRVELGEIESALRGQGLNQVAVLAIGEGFDKRLVAITDTPIPDPQSIMQSLRSTLPEYMVPAQLKHRQSLPLTDNGKIDREALSQSLNQFTQHKNAQHDGSPPNTTQNKVSSLIADLLNHHGTIDVNKNIGELGFTSLKYTLLSSKIESEFGKIISPAEFFQSNTINEIAQLIKPETPYTEPASTHQEPVKVRNKKDPGDIAIVGLWATMPMAENVQEFWDNLLQGLDCTTTIPSSRWDIQAYYGNPKNAGMKTDVTQAACLKHIDLFAAELFSISPREANLMDPRQRLLLEGTWYVLEDAGYNPFGQKGNHTGVFLGATGDDYQNMMFNASNDMDAYMLTGTSRTIISNRISYFFNWSGPSLVLDTACSSSLVAVHEAVQSIRNGHCTSAIAGGVNLLIDPKAHISLSKIGMLSPDGQCRTFDADANGYARGEGAGLIYLKPYQDAINDNDHIYAVIQSSGTEHGGRSNSLTAPNSQRQAEMINGIYDARQINRSHVRYIEAHGTGTPLGDPIEVNGLMQVLGTQSDCAIGSVKTNIGHLEAAAGIAGLIKTALTLKYNTIPPSIHLQTINKNITQLNTHFNFIKKPVALCNEHDKPHCLAGVSSFGFGGVYAHVVMGMHNPSPDKITREPLSNLLFFPISAPSPQSLHAFLNDFRKWIDHPRTKKNNQHLLDIAYTLQVGRHHFKQRLIIAANTFKSLEEQLEKHCHTTSHDLNLPHSIPDHMQHAMQQWIASKNDFPAWSLLSNQAASRTSLPTSRFPRQRYWFQNNQHIPPETNHTPTLSINVTPFLDILKDHQIQGQPILPGMFIVDQMLQISNSHVANNIVWSKPLPISDQPVALHYRQINDGANASYQITSTNNRPIAKLHIGQYPHQTLKDMVRLDTHAIDHAAPLLDRSQIYTRMATLGIELTGRFQTIQSVHQLSDQRLLCKVEATGPLSRMHLLDAMLQAILIQRMLNKHTTVSVPYSIDSLHVLTNDEMASAYITVDPIKNKPMCYTVKLFHNDGTIAIVADHIRGVNLPKQSDQAPQITVMQAKPQRISVAIPNIKQLPTSHHIQLGDHQTDTTSLDTMQDLDVVIIHLDSSVDRASAYQQVDVLRRLMKQLSFQSHTRNFKIIIRFDSVDNEVGALFASLQAYIRCIKKENSCLNIKVISIKKPYIHDLKHGIHAILKTFSPNHPVLLSNLTIHDQHLVYDQQSMETCHVDMQQETLPTLWKHQTVLILGCEGGLGSKLSSHLSQNTETTVIGLSHRDVDATNYHELLSAIQKILTGHKRIHTIINCIGVNKAAYGLRQTDHDFWLTVNSKQRVSVHLHRISEQIKAIGRIIHFSSMVVLQGAVGQSAYAMANDFLNHFTSDALTINLPYMVDGGMKMAPKNIDHYQKETGMVPMEFNMAIKLLERLLMHHHPEKNTFVSYSAGQQHPSKKPTGANHEILS